MAKNYRISLWSGGSIARGWIVPDPPVCRDGVCQFFVDQNGERQNVTLMGTVSVEEGDWERTTVRAAETHLGGGTRLSY
jgi:hypothetical protein